jgi:hypothetical protein
MHHGHRHMYHYCRREIAAIYRFVAAVDVDGAITGSRMSLKPLPTHLPSFKGSLSFSWHQIWINEKLPANFSIVLSTEFFNSLQQICCCCIINIQTDQ